MFGRRSTTAEAPAAPAASTKPAGGNGAAVIDEADDAVVALWRPTAAVARKGVEQLLLERGHITESHLDQARQLTAKTPGKSLAQLLLQMNAATEAQILSAL